MAEATNGRSNSIWAIELSAGSLSRNSGTSAMPRGAAGQDTNNQPSDRWGALDSPSAREELQDQQHQQQYRHNWDGGAQALTRWDASDTDPDNQPLTRWGAPDPEDDQKKPYHLHSHRHSNFSTERGTFSYSLDAPVVEDEPDFDTRAAAAAAEWDDDDNEPGKRLVDGMANEEPTQGWEDTIFAPLLDIKSPRILQDLAYIAEKCGVSLQHKDSDLTITADSQTELYDARKAFEIYLASLAPPPLRAKVKRIFKAERPGVWGQPRTDYASNDAYVPIP
ncbi:hypothetical protein HDU86_004030 [Geranomyces michiganensis]|nr:hypothetical protein HDU86_004030 [Geranomyces michiganensis]